MSIIQPKDREFLQKEFAENLTGPVTLVMVTQEFECQFCKETREIVEELAELSDKIQAEVYDFIADKDKLEPYGIERIPAIAVIGEKDYGIRYYGIPSGYEFSSLIETIKAVSTGETSLSDATKQALAELEQDLHIQVFVTPTCPYCPRAVLLANYMALESDRVRAEMVEAVEFPELAIKYQVQGVPRSVINETIFIEGAVPEPMFVQEVWKKLKSD